MVSFLAFEARRSYLDVNPRGGTSLAIDFEMCECVQDWPVPLQDVNNELLKCGVCDGYLGLVAQVLTMYSFLPACEFLSYGILSCA